MLNVAMCGASGRMGRAIVPLVMDREDMRLSGALAAPDDPAVGSDAGVLAGVAAAGFGIASDPAVALAEAQVAIDFTLPGPTLIHARLCRELKCAMVIGTTGFDAEAEAELREIASEVPIVLAPNMSLGVNLMFKLAELAARALSDDYDAEIFEAHHRSKVDAPSGTALGLGRAVASGRAIDLEQVAVYAREGNTGPRQRGSVGFSVMRGGDIVGEHRLIFAGPGEQVEIAHRAQDRSGFARGAVAAAGWVAGKKPALYSMFDVLGL